MAAATGEWRYIATRLNGDGTETILSMALPLAGVTFHDVLSGPLAMEFKVPHEYDQLQASDGDLLLRKWSTAIYVEEEGQIRGGYIVSNITISGSELAVSCIGFTGYPKGMPYTDSTFFVKADPLDIFRHIWTHLQSQAGGNLGLTIDTTQSPVRIGTTLTQVQFDTQSGPVSFEAGPYKLEWFSTPDLGSNIDGLAGDTPFDWHEEHSWLDREARTIKHFVRIGYPTVGRRLDLRFAVGENIKRIPQLKDSGEEYANRVLLLGRGEGRVMVRGDSDPVNDGALRRVAVVTDKTRSTKNSAKQAANTEVARRRNIWSAEQFIISDHDHARPGSYNVGDEILVRFPGTWVTTTGWYRILSISVTPADGSDRTVTAVRTDMLVP